MNAATAPRKHMRLLGKHAWLSVLGGLLMTLSMTGVADAYWTAGGTGSGSGPVGTLAVASFSGSPGAGTATLTWIAVAPPGSGPVSYYVSGGHAGGNCPTQASPTSVLTCTDTGLRKGTYNYTVTVVAQSWTATSSLAPVTLASGALDHFVLSAATTTPTAGLADNLTITAVDADGITVTGYTGTGKCIVFTGPANSPNGNAPVYPVPSGCAAGQSAVSFSSGVAATVPFTLYNASTSTVITAADAASGKSGSSAGFTVNAATAASYSMTDTSGNPLGAQTPGTPFSVKLTALDSYGNVASGYFGTKTIAWSGPGTVPSHPPIYPAGATSVIFTSGVGTATGITLYKAETPTLQALDSSAPTIKGTAIFTVSVAAIDHFSMTAATTTPSAGQADNLTITALDQYGNTAMSYAGSHSLTFSGATAIGTFTPTVTNNASGAAINFGAATAITFTNGVATVSGSANGVMKLYRAQTVSIVVSDGSHTNGTGLTVTVSAGAPSSFTVTNPGTQTAGTAFSVTLTALADAYGNAPTNYAGTQCITFSDPTASPNGTAPLYPQGSCDSGKSAVTFNASGIGTLAGVKLFDATPSTTITATDTLSGTHGTSGAFVVKGLTTMSTFVLTANPTNPTAGQAVNVTITAVDTWGNLVTTYAPTNGRVNLTFSGASTSDLGDNPTVTNRYGTQVHFGKAASIAFANGTGTATTTMRLYTAETANIVVTDGTHSNGAGLPVTVGPAAMGAFSLAAQKTVVTAGALDNLTITALDQYDNTVTSYAGSHDLTFGGASLSGAVHPTVTNSSGAATNFGDATAITFTNGVATVSGSANGVMRLYKIERAGITVAEGGAYTSDPLYVAVSATAIAVSAGAFHTCALMPSGGVECWGNNDYGQLGDNTTTDRSTPIIVSGITNATQITSGKYHTCALLADHTIRCWGWNTYGQLGDNTTTDRHTPVQVSGITTAVQVSAEGGITCALLSAGTVYCWGHNAYGQLGNGLSGEANNSSTPVQVSGITGATLVFTGANHACALLSAGSVYCWGLNDNGQLGDNTTTARSTPVQVHGVGNVGMLTGVASLNAGRFHTCVVLTTGHVDCWGYNNYGQVGDNTTTDRLTPVEAGGITTATDVTGGAYHTCVRLADGTGRCWGRNDQGQLGDGTTTQRMSPVAIVGVDGTGILRGIVDISAGGGNGNGDYEHTCVLTSDQTVHCWGYNNYGQVGDTTTTTRLYAVGVALQ